MPKVFDLFPHFNESESGVLEVRLHELYDVVDAFVIQESYETYGGARKPCYLQEALANTTRFADVADKIILLPPIQFLQPQLRQLWSHSASGVDVTRIRKEGREREAYQRNQMWAPFVRQCNPQWSDCIIFSDCDEIPSADAVRRYLAANDNVRFTPRPARFKQKSFYYNVNTLVDYGRDVCSRPRIGWISHVPNQSLYDFRMLGNKDPEFQAIENGGWHLSYFSGDLSRLKEKVNALSPFLAEYNTFDVKAIAAQQDLHRRSVRFSELPETYQFVDDSDLPAYYLANKEKFKHFTLAAFKERYGV